MLKQLKRLVEIESPSDDKAAVGRAGEQIAEWARLLGGRIRVHRFPAHGSSLEIRFGSAWSKDAPLMLLGHLDTVWAKGTLRHMPWKVHDDHICGPGVLDMKAGARDLALLRVQDLGGRALELRNQAARLVGIEHSHDGTIAPSRNRSSPRVGSTCTRTCFRSAASLHAASATM